MPQIQGKTVLSICSGMGLLDKAFIDAGYNVVPGCEIDTRMREIYNALCFRKHLVDKLEDLIDTVAGQHFTGIIGGPPCQSHSKLRSIRIPKFPDLSYLVQRLLTNVTWRWFVFENVARIKLHIRGVRYKQLNAMHYYVPHQSRLRWFTFCGVLPPEPSYRGSVDDLKAYPVVAGRIYGAKRGAWLQGYEQAADLTQFPCTWLQEGLANAVPYPVASQWATNCLKIKGV